jgi:hypothetical protein
MDKKELMFKKIAILRATCQCESIIADDLQHMVEETFEDKKILQDRSIMLLNKIGEKDKQIEKAKFVQAALLSIILVLIFAGFGILVLTHIFKI